MRRRRPRSVWLFSYPTVKPLEPELKRYTMLIAWHKFDSYERTKLVAATAITIDKLPFTTIGEVCRHLVILATRMSSVDTGHYGPVHDYHKRIRRAALKEHRKHKRVRLRIKGT